MDIWRPLQVIKVKALGLHWRGDGLLACEVYNDAGALKGVRPLGGSVEFGEDWRTALIREFKEELGIDISVHGAPLVMENIYEHEGHMGHEVLFIANVTFPPSAFEGEETITFTEDNGVVCTARWFTPKQLEELGVPLFPLGLFDRLNEV